MGFLVHTLFPEQRVSMIAADKRMKKAMKNKLKGLGVEIIEIPTFERLQSPVSGHPDMQIIHLHDNLLICHPDIPEGLVEKLKSLGFDLCFGKTELQREYPMDIAYNVAIIGGIAFHNTKYTDPLLKAMLEKYDIRLVHVKQGYSKCSVLPVTPESLITADPTIAKAAFEEGLDVLQISPQYNIRLPGVNYGFIGGTAGFIDKNLLAFTGSLQALDQKEEIQLFLEKYGVRWVDLDENGIYDYGGLLPLYQ